MHFNVKAINRDSEIRVARAKIVAAEIIQSLF